MVLRLNMEVKELAPRGYYIQPSVFSNVEVSLLPNQKKNESMHGIKGGMELIHFKPLFQSGQHVDSKGRDLWPSTVHLKIQVRYIAYINT